MKKKDRDNSGWLQRCWKTKRALMIVAIAVVILVGGIFVYLLLKEEPSPSVDQTRQTAAKAEADGDYDQALADLKKVEDKATTKAQKIAVYSDLAAAAANAGDVGEALHYYRLKYQLDPGSRGVDAYLLGTLYERSNNLPEALASYKLAVEYLKTQPSTPETEAEIKGLEAQIAQLEAGQ